MKRHFFLYYILLVAAQILLCDWFNLSPYVSLSLLPALALCIPTRYSPTAALFLTFLTGFAVDFLAEGILGLNTLALVPVGAVRLWIVRFVFGEEPIARQDNFSIRKNGLGKVIFATVLVQGLFLLVYISADGACARPMIFNLLRFFASLIAGTVVSVAAVKILTSEDKS